MTLFQIRQAVARATAPTDGSNIDPFNWAEIQRIVNLQVVRPMDSAELEVFNKEHIQVNYYNQGFRLMDAQAEAVAAYEQYGCLFADIGVGGGKTLVTLMCAAAAYGNGLERILLLVPPEVLSQLVDIDIAWARVRVSINYPIHVLGGKTLNYRKALCQSKRKGLYIMPHSLVSTKDTSENLSHIDPQLVIIDESHRFASSSAARTRRIISMLDKAESAGNPKELIILSGTITSKSINEYWHLIKHCLRDRCPLPVSVSIKNDWAALIDAQASAPDAEQGPMGSAPIMPLVQWARKHFPDTKGGFPEDVYGFRRAYKARLNSTPGVVSGGDNLIGTSLIMHNEPAGVFSPELDELCKKVQDKWLTPNDDEIDHAIHKWKWLYELSAGFYNELTWPTPEDYAKRKKITEPEAKGFLEHARIHHTSGQQYFKVLREWLLTRSKPGMDTPFLVGQEMMRNKDQNVPTEMYQLWRDWKDLYFDGIPERDSRAVRICDYKIKAAVKWVHALREEKPKSGAIMWLYHKAAGVWLVEELKKAGVANVMHCPAGDVYNDLIRNEANKHCIMVASIKAHGTGKNLQHFSEMYFFQWPRPAKDAEQTIGRLHRTGQMADEITCVTNNTMQIDQMNFAACLNDALYIHQTRNRQKLIYASYNPLPKIFPPAILVQQGLEVSRLDEAQEKAFTEKFGSYK